MSDALEQKAIDIIERVEGLLTEHTGDAWDLAQAAVRWNAVSQAVVSTVSLVILMWICRIWLGWVRQESTSYTDKDMLAFMSGLFLLILILAAGIALIGTNWLAIFAPELALVMRAIGS